eukprot:2887469-Rhodomonas_salina.2
MGPPTVYRAKQEPQVMEQFPPLGEADIKFFRYAVHFGSLVAMATDSDYIPISLIRLEKMTKTNEREPRLFLQRLRVNNDSPEAKKLQTGDKKRSARETEYVDMNLLRLGLTDALRQASMGPSRVSTAHSHDCAWMNALCALVALFGGTDFSRGIPQLGPKRVWDAMDRLAPQLAQSFDLETGQFKEEETMNTVVARIYGMVFAAHIGGGGGLQSAINALRNSKLSERTRQQIPSCEYVLTSVRNANWVLLYWGGEQRDEMSGDFGYKKRGNAVTYEDNYD